MAYQTLHRPPCRIPTSGRDARDREHRGDLGGEHQVPSIFSLPLMKSIGPLAFPVTIRRKSTPSSVRVTRGAALGSGLVVQARLVITTSQWSSPLSGRPAIRQMDHGVRGARGLEVLLHAP